MSQPKRSDFRISRAFSGRYGFLLLSQLALLITMPVIVDGWGWNMLMRGIASIVLIAGLRVAYRGPRPLVLGLIVAALDLGLGAFVIGSGVYWLLIAEVLLWIVTLWYIASVILEDVLASQKVSMETLQAAICVYILMGMIWTFLYAFIDLVSPSSFSFDRDPKLLATSAGLMRAEFLRLFFLSYSTMTAVGGGGIEQTSWFVRMCACIEAMIGQIYIGVLIARLVAIHVGQIASKEN